MAKTPQQMADAWAQRMASGDTAKAYKDGIMGYNGNPMAQAAQAVDDGRYLDGVNKAVNSGRMSAALRSANPQSWKDGALNVGMQRLSSGATKGKGKALAAFTRLAPAYAAMRAAADALPKSDGRGRMLAAHDALMRAVGKA